MIERLEGWKSQDYLYKKINEIIDIINKIILKDNQDNSQSASSTYNLASDRQGKVKNE